MKTFHSCNVENVTCIPCEMETKQETLAGFVRRVRSEKGLSLKDVERHSRRMIGASYVSRIENGEALNPTALKLRGLARGLGVPEDTIFAVAYGRPQAKDWSESRFYELFELYQTLVEPRHKQLVERGLEDLLLIVRAFPRKADGSVEEPEAVRKAK